MSDINFKLYERFGTAYANIKGVAKIQNLNIDYAGIQNSNEIQINTFFIAEANQLNALYYLSLNYVNNYHSSELLIANFLKLSIQNYRDILMNNYQAIEYNDRIYFTSLNNAENAMSFIKSNDILKTLTKRG